MNTVWGYDLSVRSQRIHKMYLSLESEPEETEVMRCVDQETTLNSCFSAAVLIWLNGCHCEPLWLSRTLPPLGPWPLITTSVSESASSSKFRLDYLCFTKTIFTDPEQTAGWPSTWNKQSAISSPGPAAKPAAFYLLKILIYRNPKRTIGSVVGLWSCSGKNKEDKRHTSVSWTNRLNKIWPFCYTLVLWSFILTVCAETLEGRPAAEPCSPSLLDIDMLNITHISSWPESNTSLEINTSNYPSNKLQVH